MIFDFHIRMSQILYKHISKDMNFKLDRVAFTFDNVKQDPNNKVINCGHTLDKSLYKVNKYLEKLINENISIKELSRG